MSRFWFEHRSQLTISITLAFILWLTVKLNKRVSHDVIVSVGLELNDNRKIINQPIQSFPLRLNGQVSQMMRFSNRLRHDTLRFSADEDQMTIEVSADKILDEINRLYVVKRSVIIDPIKYGLTFVLDTLSVRTLPVKMSAHITYAEGYGPSSALNYYPTEVSVYGTETLLETLDSIPTDSMGIINITDDIDKVLGFESLGLENVRIEPNEIKLTQKIKPLVEREFFIHREEYQSDGQMWQLFPKDVIVRVSAPTDILDSLSNDSFIIKYEDIGNQAMSVSIVDLPKFVHYVNHQPKVLRFFKKE